MNYFLSNLDDKRRDRVQYLNIFIEKKKLNIYLKQTLLSEYICHIN